MRAVTCSRPVHALGARRARACASERPHGDFGRATSTVRRTRVASSARDGRSARGRVVTCGFFKRLLSLSRDDDRDDGNGDGKDGGRDAREATGRDADADADADVAVGAMDAVESVRLPKTDMKTTLSDLDLLLGIDSEAEARKKEEEESAWRATLRSPSADEDAANDGTVELSISPKAMEQLKNVEEQRRAEMQRKGASKAKGDELEKVLNDLSARANKNKESGRSMEEDAELQASMKKLVDILENPEEEQIPAADVDKIKKEVFGMQTFYVTAVENLGEEMNGAGVLFKGNLRAERAEVWKSVQSNIASLFDGQYTAFMLEEPLSEDGPGGDASIDSKYGPRVSFLIVPSDRAGPSPQTPGWQYVLALVLMGLTVGSAVQLGLVAEVSRLPPETMTWLRQAGEVDLPDGVLPPGLENFDSVSYVESALPVTVGVMAASVGHEIGHQIAAFMRKIKIGVPFLIPNSQLGTFGTLTQIKSTPETRSDLFDVSAAGPVAGCMVALNLFVYGLSLSVSGDNPDLIPIPSTLFNTSLLLGSISQLFLHATAKGILVHPYFIAGWCALTTQALNLLPVGSIDGGRMAQSAFGRRVLGATSLGTYIGLSFGVIASSLSLPWAIYIVLTQRTPEFAPKDDVTPVDDSRATLAFAMIAVAFLILLPGPIDASTAEIANIPF